MDSRRFGRLVPGLRSPPGIAAVAAVLVMLGLLHYALTEDVANPYAGTHLAIGVTSTGVGAWVAHRRRAHPLGWVLLATGLAATITFATQPAAVQGLIHHAPEWLVRAVTVGAAGWIVARTGLFVAAPSVMPDGWPTGARRVVLWVGLTATAVLVLVNQLVWLSQPFASEGDEITVMAQLFQPIQRWAEVVVWVASVAAVVGMVVAVVRHGQPARRQQRWFVVGCALLTVPALLASAQNVLEVTLVGGNVDRMELLASALLPLALVLAIVQDGMLDIAVVIRRGVVYVVLTVAATAVYLVAVGIAWLVAGESSVVAPLVGAGVVAIAFQPLRVVVQRVATRRLFGAIDEPYEMLQSLGRRLAHSRARGEALPALAQEVGAALRLQYVAVELDVSGQPSPLLVAESGGRVVDVERFPLVFGGEEIGRLVVGGRGGGEPLRARERKILEDLARHAGVITHDAIVSLDLVQSRRDLVVAREEERRRLRGDLHDGLGPILASVSLGLEAAAAQLQDDEELARLLVDLNASLRAAMADLRRVVYGLRPPALDELGLARAVQEHIRANLAGKGSAVAFEFEANGLPVLPAAVELAAYRIALEALTNVQRHAGARRCWVSLKPVGSVIELVVRDDGRGMDGTAHGVGMVSMRRRAEDLGGGLEVVSEIGKGTTVRAVLPVGARPSVDAGVP